MQAMLVILSQSTLEATVSLSVMIKSHMTIQMCSVHLGTLKQPLRALHLSHWLASCLANPAPHPELKLAPQCHLVQFGSRLHLCAAKFPADSGAFYPESCHFTEVPEAALHLRSLTAPKLLQPLPKTHLGPRARRESQLLVSALVYAVFLVAFLQSWAVHHAQVPNGLLIHILHAS